MAKGRIRTSLSAIGQNWKMTSQAYPTLPLEVIGLLLGVGAAVAIPVGLLVNWLTGILLGIPVGLLAATFWFSRRAVRAAYKRIEGQPGAAAAVLENMRGWAVTPAVAVSKNQDMISRVVGKPGVILVGEGPASRISHMLANERKKTARWVPEIPIYEIQVGDDEGQITLLKLQRSIQKLPRSLRGGEITEVRRRLEALGNARNSMPVPKGPIPTSPRQVRRPR
ncbi:MAG: DUF4191 domain-containing protein [Actinobacteria bacterium]|nr:DUF4191 domain-containing protein [Actinomycetota bacterium]